MASHPRANARLGGGVGVINGYADTTSMSGRAWTTATDVQWHVRPLVVLTTDVGPFCGGLRGPTFFGSTPRALCRSVSTRGRR